MRWLLWGRQYGKTYQTIKWFLEDPENRVILVQDEHYAETLRRQIHHDTRGQRQPSSSETESDWKALLKTNIAPVQRWVRKGPYGFGPRGPFPRLTVAVDNLELCLPQIIGADVALVTASGVNEKPVGLRVDPDAVRFEQQREAEEQ